VGIGSAFPGSKLVVVGTSGAAADVAKFRYEGSDATSTINVLVLERNTTGTATDGMASRIRFNTEKDDGVTGGGIAAIDGITTDTDAGDLLGELAFTVNGVGVGFFEAVRINKDGYVGIGTTDPLYHLHVKGSVTDAVNVYAEGNSAGFVLHDMNGTADKSIAQMYVNADKWRLRGIKDDLTENKSGIAFDLNTGFIGIGTTDPKNSLHVVASGTAGTPAISAWNMAAFQRSSSAGANSYISVISGNTAKAGIYFGDTGDEDAGSIAYNHSTNGMEFRTNTFQSMVLESGGYLGIGTTDAKQPLDISFSAPIIRLSDETSTSIADVGAIMEFYHGTTARAGWLGFGSSGDEHMSLHSQTANGEIRFGTNNNVRMRIMSGGNVVIGGSSSSYKLEVCGTLATTAASVTTSITCSSDERLKKNIATLNNSLDNIMALRGVSFDWRVDEFPDKGFTKDNQIGFIAQELEELYPELVVTQPDGFKSVDYSKLTPVLLQAIKEQQMLIKDLQERMASVEAATAN